AYAHAADAFPERVDWAVDAWGAVPNFTAAGILASEIALHSGEYDRALDTSDRILEIVPTHRRALLSRLRALSGLRRHADAVAVAEALIALGRWYLGDAY